ncbi:transglycosylase SLT domain-containing protein [Telluria aromaticivorans]|uniref:Transglycosylase SLT domain-containing protein n=1 Tax=Telluria aromaticivorans TaxID=2725995 RepID=A0A7Y2P125_9BURK|nr:transglycosylase SLT domain-containing protein [Telluria aromaticivorans]NNG23429.1 transglycosylase SLT domain-containing protein [Telluria aromaticivorans]
MHDMIRKTLATAALALLAAPMTYAMETAPAAPVASTATASASTLRPALLTAPGLLKADEFKETDVWGRIRSGYAIPDIDNSLVARHTQAYSVRPDSLKRISGRASPYLYHIVQELEKRGMPTELALLPVIESAFNPQALSTASAAGLWQFVPGTGKDYDLKQNMFKDERRGVLASTDAALTYLQRLYTMFGDWQLALAAYNWGEGNVQRAIKKNQALGKGTDFESLAELMPAETRNYVPKLQAVKNIVANPAQYNVALPAIDNQPYFTAIDKTSDIDVAVAAQLAEMSLDEFRALNPQFKKPVITGGEKTKILLPKENAEKFHLNLAQWGRNLSTWTTHKITGARVSIASLASKFGTTPEIIRQANNIPAKSTVSAGSTILVPKVSASNAGDIADNIIENAVVAFEAERSASKRVKASSGSRYKSKAEARTSKNRIARNTSSKRKHR